MADEPKKEDLNKLIATLKANRLPAFTDGKYYVCLSVDSPLYELVKNDERFHVEIK